MPTKGRAKRGAGQGATAVERLRRLCLALPGAEERASHGAPAWFAGKGRSFAALDDHHHGAEHLSVWLPAPLGVQEALVAQAPHRYFRPPYVGGRGWVGAILDGAPDWAAIAGLVREAYLLVAGARLRRRLLEPQSSGVTGPARAQATRRRRGSRLGTR